MESMFVVVRVFFLTCSTLAPKGVQRGSQGCPREPKVVKKLPKWNPKVLKIQQKCSCINSCVNTSGMTTLQEGNKTSHTEANHKRFTCFNDICGFTQYIFLRFYGHIPLTICTLVRHGTNKPAKIIFFNEVWSEGQLFQL